MHKRRMRPHSRQILVVEETFGRNGWHCELVEGRDVNPKEWLSLPFEMFSQGKHVKTLHPDRLKLPGQQLQVPCQSLR